MSDEPTAGVASVESCKALIERHVLEAAGQADGLELGSGAVVADSIVFAEVIAAIEDETGIEVPMDDSTARALRSLDSFASLIHGLLVTREGAEDVG
jgi:acyl carrier protein